MAVSSREKLITDDTAAIVERASGRQRGELVLLLILFYTPLCIGLIQWALSGNRTAAATSVLSRLAGKSKREKLASDFATGFAGRSQLLKLYAYATVGGLHISSTPKVAIGRHGWLFYAAPDSNLGLNAQQPLSEEELARLSATIEGRRAWLDAHGISYLLVIAPDKHTIYPEMLPPGFTLPRQSRLQQVVAYLRAHTHAEILDLTSTMLASKALFPCYYRTDAHWNLAGACAASQALLRHVKSQWPGVLYTDPSTLRITSHGTFNGDLARMLDMQEWYSEPDWEVHFGSASMAGRDQIGQKSVKMAIGDESLSSIRKCTLTCNEGAVPRAVLVGDSFCERLLAFLAPGFRRLTFVRSPTLDRALIAKEKPNLVIHEIVERNLNILSVSDP